MAASNNNQAPGQQVAENLVYGALNALSGQFLVLSPEGRVLYANQPCGRQPNALKAEIGADYLAACEKAAEACGEAMGHLAQGIREVSAGMVEAYTGEYACAEDKDLNWFQVRVVRLADNGLLVTHEDINEGRRKTVQLEESESRLRQFYRISHDKSISLEERIQQLLAFGCATFGLELGIQSRVEGPSHIVEAVHPREGGIGAGERFSLKGSCGEKTLQADSLLAVTQAGENGGRGQAGVESYLGIPIHVAGKPYGILGFSSTQPRSAAFTEADRALLQIMAQWMEEELERRQAAEALSESEGRLSAILNNAQAVIFLKDLEGRYLLVNRQYVKINGIPPEKILGQTDDAIYPPAIARQLRKNDQRTLNTGVPLRLEETVPLEGRPHSFLVTKFPLFDDAGTAYAIGGIATDITDLKETQAELQETSLLQRAILNAADYSIISTDEKGIIRTFNHAAERMLGYRAEEVIGKATPELFHDADELQQWADDMSRELGEPFAVGFGILAAKAERRLSDQAEWTYIRKDGQRLPVLLSVTAVRNKNKHLTGYLAIGTDISERLKLERTAARAQANELSRSVTHAMGQGVIGLDSELKITFANPKTEQLLGYSEKELQGKFVCRVLYECKDPVEEHEAPHECELREVVQAGRTVQADDTIFFRRSGQPFPAAFVASPIREEGVVTGAALSFQDISLRKETENAMRRHLAELARMNAELDEFTYVASHDLQEPLRKLTSFSDWLRKDLGDDLPPRAQQDLDYIGESVGRMRGLIQDLLALSRAGRVSMSRRRLSLNHAADRALENLELAIREKGATIEREALPEVWGDETMLFQLYQNLISNALKFSGPRAPEIRLTARQMESGNWEFGVEDKGIGLKREYAELVFQPFKRLHGRAKYEGSGIGLSICRKVVERHGGRIWVESEEGKGAHFKFTLYERSHP
jgi:PAS domain S-box-containing protein